MRTWDGECSIPQIMRAFNFLVTVQKLQHTCTFFPHHFLLLNLKLEQLCSESEREREACCHANMTRKQRRSDEMRLIISDSYNWIVEYFTVQMTSDEGDCHIFFEDWFHLLLFCPFTFFLGSYPFSGTLVTLVIALIASDVDKFILWEGECDVPKWMYPAEGM